jgi:transposase
VVPGATRRILSKSEKLRILAAADTCTAPGDIGALLFRERIYSAHLATWRKQRQLARESQLLEAKHSPKVRSQGSHCERTWCITSLTARSTSTSQFIPVEYLPIRQQQ